MPSAEYTTASAYRIQLKMRLSDWIILAVTVAATAGSIWLMLWQF